MRKPNKNIQRRTFVKIRFNTITLHSIHTVHNQSINSLVKWQHMGIHGHYLSYKQAIYTNVYNLFWSKILKDKWISDLKLHLFNTCLTEI